MASRAGVSNQPLLGAVLLTFALQMATIYVPVLNPIFKTEPLSAGELAICVATGCRGVGGGGDREGLAARAATAGRRCCRCARRLRPRQ